MSDKSKIIFATTNQRKIEDLQHIIDELGLDMGILSLNDIGWDRGEIEEKGTTIQDNSLAKARAVFSFCKEKRIYFPIISDDSGLFVDVLGDEPGVHTARYADAEIAANPNLPSYQCIIKLIEKMRNTTNRHAKYKSYITLMTPDGKYFQELGESNGTIMSEIPKIIEKPFFYSIFVPDGFDVAFGQLRGDALKNTYRFESLRKAIRRLATID